MARAYILSHGERHEGDQDTFVPEGRTLAFYSDFDEYTWRSAGLAALNTGDIAPVATLTGGDTVSNYELQAFEDSAMAEHLASVSSATGGTPYFVGAELPSPLRLCDQPEECQQSYPRHADSCGGLFALIGEDDIHTVSCRGVSGVDGATTMSVDGGDDYANELAVEAARLRTWLAQDAPAAVAYWESLTEATRVQLTGISVDLEDEMTAYYDAGGASTPAAVVQARQYLADAGEEAFYDWVVTLDDTQRDMILAQDLREAFDREQARRAQPVG